MNKKKRNLIWIFLTSVLLFLSVLSFLILGSFNKTCSDGTPSNSCSKILPYFCVEGNLIERASVCGCFNISFLDGDRCKAPYSTGEKNISLNYTLRGDKGVIIFSVYKGLYDYLTNLPRYSISEENYTLLDFRKKMIDNEYQRELLLPLILEIQEITSNKEDQARIILSLVQNIPFGKSNKSVSFGSLSFDYLRFPYEVLYELQGVCGEKSSLAIFLLREIGYGCSFIYYSRENHEAVGIKCESQYSINNSGYCFVETTFPSIILDNKSSYVGLPTLNSDPKILVVAEGVGLDKYEQEYLDAKILNGIRESAKKKGVINPIQYLQYKILKSRYGFDFFG